MGRSVLKKKNLQKKEELNVLRSTWPQKTAIGVAKNIRYARRRIPAPILQTSFLPQSPWNVSTLAIVDSFFPDHPRNDLPMIIHAPVKGSKLCKKYHRRSSVDFSWFSFGIWRDLLPSSEIALFENILLQTFYHYSKTLFPQFPFLQAVPHFLSILGNSPKGGHL